MTAFRSGTPLTYCGRAARRCSAVPGVPTTRAAKGTTVPRLPCPLDAEADDVTLFSQVVSYYHERLKSCRRRRWRVRIWRAGVWTATN